MRQWQRLPLILAGLLAVLVWIPREPDTGAGRTMSAPKDAERQPARSPMPVAHGEPRGITRRSPEPGTGTLRGWVEDPTGEPIQGVLLELSSRSRDDGSLDAGAETLVARSDAAGEFRMPLPGPRSWVLRAGTYLHDGVERRIHGRGHGEVAVTLVLSRRPSVGSVRGHVVSATGTYHRPVRVSLAPEGTPPRLAAEVDWVHEEGWWKGRFEIHDVPFGEFTVRAHTRGNDPQRLEQRTHRVQAPAEDIFFFIHDDDPRFDWEFSPYDATTGAPLESFEIEFQWPEDPDSVRCVQSRGPHVVRGLSEGSLPPWTLRAEGYRTRSDLDDARTLEVGGEAAPPPLERRPWELWDPTELRGHGALLPGTRRVLWIPMEPLDPSEAHPDSPEPIRARSTDSAPGAGPTGQDRRLPGIG